MGGGARGDAVGDLDLEHVRRPAQDDLRAAAAAVLERVGETLLDQPEGGQVDAGRQRPGPSLDAQLDVEPGVARAGDERAEAIERGLRGVVGVLAVGAQDAEQAAHLGQRLAAGRLDRAQRADRGVRVAVEHAARGPGLHDHDRDRMRDDVVQLAGDPYALARHRVALTLGALALELLGARPQLGGQARAAAAEAPQSPAAPEEHDGEDDVADRLVGPERSDHDHHHAHAGEAGLRAAARQVRADGEGQDGDEDRGRGEVLGRRVGEREGQGHRADRGQRRERRRAAPGHRRGQDGAQQQRGHERRRALGADDQLDLDDHAERGRQGEIGAARARDRHAAGSPTGRRARSSKPRGRRRPALSSPP
jgi:hypothetical protein